MGEREESDHTSSSFMDIVHLVASCELEVFAVFRVCHAARIGSFVTYSTSYWGKEETKNISPNLLRVILFLICCTTAFSIDFVYKLWSE